MLPTTFGTVIGAGPLLTKKVTVEPGTRSAPADGSWRATSPVGTLALCSSAPWADWNPALLIAEAAALGALFTTFGTGTGAGPLLTT